VETYIEIRHRGCEKQQCAAANRIQAATDGFEVEEILLQRHELDRKQATLQCHCVILVHCRDGISKQLRVQWSITMNRVLARELCRRQFLIFK